MEALLERTMYAARWLLAPIYMGLSLAIVLLGIKFFEEVFHVFPTILGMSEAELVLVILSLIDMALVGGLLVMVMFSGYENFVSRLDSVSAKDGLDWLGKMDSGSLKNKVAVSIVAISSIHLLQIFMNAQNVANDKIMWYVILHLTFVLSAFCMGYLDQVTKKTAVKAGHPVQCHLNTTATHGTLPPGDLDSSPALLRDKQYGHGNRGKNSTGQVCDLLGSGHPV